MERVGAKISKQYSWSRVLLRLLPRQGWVIHLLDPPPLLLIRYPKFEHSSTSLQPSKAGENLQPSSCWLLGPVSWRLEFPSNSSFLEVLSSVSNRQALSPKWCELRTTWSSSVSQMPAGFCLTGMKWTRPMAFPLQLLQWFSLLVLSWDLKNCSGFSISSLDILQHSMAWTPLCPSWVFSPLRCKI